MKVWIDHVTNLGRHILPFFLLRHGLFAMNPNPKTLNPNPETLNPNPITLNPKLYNTKPLNIYNSFIFIIENAM